MLQHQSLKTRVTLATLLVSLLGIWTVALYAVRTLRADTELLLGQQQDAIVSLVAQEMGKEVAQRQAALQALAAHITPAMLADPLALQARLAADERLDALFNGGYFVVGPDGRALASVPVEAKRIGIGYIDRDYIASPMWRGQFTIGQPVIGRALASPVVGFGVPVRGPQGQVLGVLAGIVNLGQPSFLDRITTSHHGQGGTYLLVDRQHRIIVTSSDKRRILEQLPPAGALPAMDRFFNGFEGSQVFVNPQGVEVLASSHWVPQAPWQVAVYLPTREAFALLDALVLRLLLAAAGVSLLMAAVVWWLMRRQLAPLVSAARALAGISAEEAPLEPLPVVRTDEVGTLIASFNRMLAAMALRQRHLCENEERYRTIFRTSPYAVTISRVSDGVFLDANDGFLNLTGWTLEQVMGKTPEDLGLWQSEEDHLSFRMQLDEAGQCRDFETQWRSRDGRTMVVKISIDPLTLNGEHCLLGVIQDITAQRDAQDRIQQLAFSDPLTELPNRRLLLDRMEQAQISAMRHRTYCALLHIDLDAFKTVNETLGHDQGDLLLQQVARRLAYTIRDVDTVARLGADEFVVLAEELSTDERQAAAQAEAIGEKLMAALNQPYRLTNSEQFSTGSIGIALFGLHGEAVLEPLKRAELAMYEAKASGRNNLRFFDPAMQAVVSARVALEAGLREAIEKRQFVLHYQPQLRVDPTTMGAQEITGAEVLLRWHDPLRGMVSPAEFIPVAEESGLILPIGHWVLETACEQLARWKHNAGMASLTIAVNVSARQFHQEHFVAQVEDILQRTGAPAERLKIELTESMLVADIAGVITKMRALKHRGVGFSLDDFGTGYSSLSYLKRLPLDQLKIDQGFVRDILVDPDDAAIASTVIALAGSLNLGVIAEGVETQAQRERLATLGCHAYQGYLISKPLPLDAFEALVQAATQVA